MSWLNSLTNPIVSHSTHSFQLLMTRLDILIITLYVISCYKFEKNVLVISNLFSQRCDTYSNDWFLLSFVSKQLLQKHISFANSNVHCCQLQNKLIISNVSSMVQWQCSLHGLIFQDFCHVVKVRPDWN